MLLLLACLTAITAVNGNLPGGENENVNQEQPEINYLSPIISVSLLPHCESGYFGEYPNCQVSPPLPQQDILPPLQDDIVTPQNIPQTQPSECPSGTYGYYPNCQLPEASPPSNPIAAADFTEQNGYNYPIPSQPFN